MVKTIDGGFLIQLSAKTCRGCLTNNNGENPCSAPNHETSDTPRVSQVAVFGITGLLPPSNVVSIPGETSTWSRADWK